MGKIIYFPLPGFLVEITTSKRKRLLVRPMVDPVDFQQLRSYNATSFQFKKVRLVDSCDLILATKKVPKVTEKVRV